ncbi:MAG: amidohydrolase [Bacteroidota bacterium]
MPEKLNVALIQTELFWEDPKRNREHFERKILTIPEGTDLIILPEMFTSGFTMNAEKVAESMDGITVNWMKHLAKTKDAAIIGSIVISENEAFYNRLLFVLPNGQIRHYDKKHTFTLAGEHKAYSAGHSQALIEFRGWKILPLICYDLRFPVWARNTMDYDVLLYVANWPNKRISAWDTLLKARAIENMSYCIGVNRIGEDANGRYYPGHSAVYDVLGNKLDTIESNESIVEIVSIDKKEIDNTRKKLGFLNDRDNFILM